MTIERLNTRLAQARPSATYRIIDRVAARRAEGASLISLCAGEPDFDTPEHIRQAGIDAIRNGHTRYTQVAGVRALREAVAQKFRRENGLDVTWQDTLVSNGGKHVIYNALAATLNAGDEVIVPAPYWVSYPEMVELCGGTARILPCAAQEGFKLTAAALEQAITPRTRWLILNSPSNPTGAVYSRLELQALAQVLLKHPHVLVLADDIYEHLLFGGQTFHTLAQVEPRLAPRVLTMNGVSKAYAMTGWRIGFATGPQDFIQQSRAVFEQRRDLVVALLNASPGLECMNPDGAFYAFASCAGLLGRTTPAGKRLHTDEDVADALLDEAHVAVVPGSAFGLAPYLRIAYALDDTSLRQACEAIHRFCAATR